MAELNLLMEGLNCANCAGKIEKRVKRLPGVDEAFINLMNQEMLIEFEGVEKSSLINQISDITVALEPNVSVCEKQKDFKNCPYRHSGAVCDGQCILEEIGSKNTAGDKNSLRLMFLNIDFKMRILKYATAVLLYIFALTEIFGEDSALFFFLTAYALFGADVIVKAVKNIVRGELFDENFLMSISTLGAFIIGQYAEAVAVMLFYQAGEFCQDIAVDKSRKSIQSLMNLKADYANLIKGDTVSRVDPAAVAVGDIILIKPGEIVPLDGIVLEGETQIDASSIIGESVPRSARVGDTIISGTVNLTGVIKMKAVKDYENSTVAKIMDMVENASNKKAPAERFITRFSKVYTPIVVVLAAMLAFIPPLMIENAIFSDWLYRGLVFLVVSCPCALVISVPLSFFSGIGFASGKGILVKGSIYLQSLSEIDTVVFDKTGTLTKGVFTVTKINPANGCSSAQLMQYAASAERFSNHPIAKSILKSYEKANSGAYLSLTGYEEIGGKGVKAFISGKLLLAGNMRLMEDHEIKANAYHGEGTAVHVALDNRYLGYIIISDVIKEDSKTAIETLKSKGIKTVMLTGDRKKAAHITAKRLGIDEVYSELLPHEKVHVLESLYEKNPRSKIAFTGDGINDAPVLARADVGIAMGGLGSDAAIEAADVVIMTDEPSKISTAIQTAQKTMTIARQNIVFALGIKIFVLILSAVGIASMWLAVFADVGVALIAVMNSMRHK